MSFVFEHENALSIPPLHSGREKLFSKLSLYFCLFSYTQCLRSTDTQTKGEELQENGDFIWKIEQGGVF